MKLAAPAGQRTAGDTPRAGPSAPAAHPYQQSILLVLLFTTLIAGRLTLDSWGIESGEGFELRIPLLIALLLWFFLWLGTTRRDLVRRWPTAMKLAVLHLAVLMMSALWADERARIVAPVLDLLLLVIFICIAVNATAVDPRGAAAQFIVMLYVTGTVYAVAGLIANTFTAGRLTAFGGGPNVFVRVVLLGLLAAVVLAVQQRRLGYLLPAPVLAYAALLSGSRGGLVSATVVAALALLYYARHLHPKYVVAGVTVMACGLYALIHIGPEDRFAQMTGRYSSIERLTASDRGKLIGKAVDIFHAHPFAGKGIDSFAATYAPGQRGMYAHNYLASVLADTGLVGLAALIAGLVAVFVAVLRRLRTATPAQAGLLFAAAFILATSNFSGDYYDSRLGWAFLAVGLTGAAAVRRRLPPAVRVPYGGHRGRGPG